MHQFDKRRFLTALDPDVDNDYLVEDVFERDVVVHARTMDKFDSSLPWARITVRVPRDSCTRGPMTATLQDTGHEVAQAIEQALGEWELKPMSYAPDINLSHIEDHRKTPERYVFESEIQIPSKSAS